MSSDLQDYLRVRKATEQYRRDIDRAQGAWDQLMEELASKFGCRSEEEAHKLLTKLKKGVESSWDEFHQEVQNYITKHGERLGI